MRVKCSIETLPWLGLQGRVVCTLKDGNEVVTCSYIGLPRLTNDSYQDDVSSLATINFRMCGNFRIG